MAAPGRQIETEGSLPKEPTMQAARLELSLVPIARPEAPAAAAPTRGALRRGDAMAPAAPGAVAMDGPGWFMSSWELQHGLEVREGWPGDTGLNEWIDGFLRV
jgi:hypothetical protein